MYLTLNPRVAPDFDAMSAHEVGVVLANARALRTAGTAGTTQTLLSGKKLGLVCEEEGAEAALFRGAASQLGAHVSSVRPGLTPASPPDQVLHTAQLLGRLYDGLECQGLDAALVSQFGSGSGVPTFDNLASTKHPTARLDPQLGNELTAQEGRRLMVQAVLVSLLA